MLDRILEDARGAGGAWEPVRAGFFDGSLDEVYAAADHVKEHTSRVLAASSLRARLEAAQPLEK